MTHFVKKLLLIALLFEVILFLMLYCFGPNGYHVLLGLNTQKQVLAQEVKQLYHDITTLEENIRISQTPFAKEAIARERLFMKRDNEIVYLKK